MNSADREYIPSLCAHTGDSSDSEQAHEVGADQVRVHDSVAHTAVIEHRLQHQQDRHRQQQQQHDEEELRQQQEEAAAYRRTSVGRRLSPHLQRQSSR